MIRWHFKALQQRTGMTVEKAAERLDVSVKTVYEYRKAATLPRLSEDTLERILDGLGCEIEELLERVRP